MANRVISGVYIVNIEDALSDPVYVCTTSPYTFNIHGRHIRDEFYKKLKISNDSVYKSELDSRLQPDLNRDGMDVSISSIPELDVRPSPLHGWDKKIYAERKGVYLEGVRYPGYGTYVSDRPDGIILSASGLSRPDLEVTTENLNTGTVPTGVRTTDRQITMSVGSENLQEFRDKLMDVSGYGRNKYCIVVIEVSEYNFHTGEYMIKEFLHIMAIFSKMDETIFSNKKRLTITFICPNPKFESRLMGSLFRTKQWYKENGVRELSDTWAIQLPATLVNGNGNLRLFNTARSNTIYDHNAWYRCFAVVTTTSTSTGYILTCTDGYDFSLTRTDGVEVKLIPNQTSDWYGSDANIRVYTDDPLTIFWDNTRYQPKHFLIKETKLYAG